MACVAAETQKTSGEPRQNSKARKIDIPVLAKPNDVDLAHFSDWQTRWKDYVKLTCVREEVPDTVGRQAILRSALSSDWSILWSTGRLGIKDSDDMDGIIFKLRRHVHKRRNPLLDRKIFNSRDKHDSESMDQYLAVLVRLYNACAYEDNLPACCHCGKTWSGGESLRRFDSGIASSVVWRTKTSNNAC